MERPRSPLSSLGSLSLNSPVKKGARSAKSSPTKTPAVKRSKSQSNLQGGIGKDVTTQRDGSASPSKPAPILAKKKSLKASTFAIDVIRC